MIEIKAETDVFIEMRDGVHLAADIFRPDAKGKFPALLAMCPFCKDVQAMPIHPQPYNSPLWAGFLEAGDSEYFVRKTEMNLLIPKISIPAATPANSEITFPMFVRNMPIIR